MSWLFLLLKPLSYRQRNTVFLLTNHFTMTRKLVRFDWAFKRLLRNKARHKRDA